MGLIIQFLFFFKLHTAVIANSGKTDLSIIFARKERFAVTSLILESCFVVTLGPMCINVATKNKNKRSASKKEKKKSAQEN